MTTSELVDVTGLHENTVREHLERLQRDGHVRRSREQTSRRGRPAWRWQAVGPDRVSPYAALAATLASAVTDAAPNPAASAREAGAEWGRRLVDGRADRGDVDPRTLVTDVMREQGFAPDPGRPSDPTRLRACPLLSAASGNPTVVCGVHEGMIDGISRAAGSDLTVRLEPFAEPDACLLHLRAGE